MHSTHACALPAGVLFALEEATSVWNRKLAWRCFLCASVAVFTMAELHPRTHEGMLSFNGAWPLNNLQVGRGAGHSGICIR